MEPAIKELLTAPHASGITAIFLLIAIISAVGGLFGSEISLSCEVVF
jgi:hypothetical protein